MPSQARITRITCIETVVDSEYPLSCQVEVEVFDPPSMISNTLPADAGTTFSDALDTWAADDEFTLV